MSETAASTVEEKYKATQLWNDVIRKFRAQLPQKTHKKTFKSYEGTFTGSEAVDWLHGYLCAKAEISTRVGRLQSLNLLQKFYERGLFCEIAKKGKCSGGFSVKDNGTLYRFSDLSPTKIAQTPLALKNADPKSSVFRNATASATNPKTFRELFPGGEQEILPVLPKDSPELEKFDANVVDENPPSSFYHYVRNSINTTRHTFRAEKESDSCTDRFDVAWKHVALKKLQEVLRWNSLDLVVDTSLINGSCIAFNASNVTNNDIVKVTNVQDELPHYVLQAMKCLANWPWFNTTLNLSYYDDFERDVLATVLDFYNNHGPLIPDEFRELFISALNRVEFLDVYEWDKSCYAQPEDELENLTFLEGSIAHNVNELSDLDSNNVIRQNDVVEETEFGVFDEQSPVSRLRRRKCARSLSFRGFAAAGAKKLHAQFARGRHSYALTSRYHRKQTLEDVLNTLPGLIKSPSLLNRLKQDKETAAVSSGDAPPKPISSQGPFAGSLLAPTTSFPKYTSNSSCTHSATLSFFTHRGRRIAVEAIRLCLLCLPPKNRRWLHLLVRMIRKVSHNHCLKLDKFGALSNRVLAVESFCNCLFNHGYQFTNKQSTKLLSYLVDEQIDLFESPEEIKKQVEKLVDDQCLADVAFSSGISTETSFTYCEQIPSHLFIPQGLYSSRQALMDLLDSIVKDNIASLTEKRKRLKRFAKSYPNLFAQRFPTKASLDLLFSQKFVEI